MTEESDTTDERTRDTNASFDGTSASFHGTNERTLDTTERTGDAVDTIGIESDHELVAIVAVAENGVIGRDGDMPWHVPEDLKRFKETTMDHPVVMGRVTYESIVEALGEPLPGRTSVVLTTRELETPDDVVVASGLAEAIETAETAARDRHDGTDRIFVAGGATVYEQLLPAVDRLLVTEIQDEPDGDAYFPALDPESWRETSKDEREGFTFLEYVRRT